MKKILILTFIIPNLLPIDFKYFTETEVKKIYAEKVKKPVSYFKKFEHLPLHFNNKNWKWEDNDFARIWCLLDLKELIAKYQINPINELASTNLGDPEIEYLEYKNITPIIYDPSNNTGDLHKNYPPFANKFDFFLFMETLEHLYNPFLAMQNIYNMIKPGGYVFTSVPYMNIPHEMPFHFTGFKPMGLALLFLSCGFEIKEMGQWGNYEYLQKLFKNHKWPDYQELIKDGKITNEDRNVVKCWILAQKPLEANKR